MINLAAIELKCKTADLVAEDRRKHGRDPGPAAYIRQEYENCAKDIADGFRAINSALNRAGY